MDTSGPVRFTLVVVCRKGTVTSHTLYTFVLASFRLLYTDSQRLDWWEDEVGQGCTGP
jgi:hypothetical protein